MDRSSEGKSAAPPPPQAAITVTAAMATIGKPGLLTMSSLIRPTIIGSQPVSRRTGCGTCARNDRNDQDRTRPPRGMQTISSGSCPVPAVKQEWVPFIGGTRRTGLLITFGVTDLTFQGSLFSPAEPEDFDGSFRRMERLELPEGAWVERQPGWASQPDLLFVTALESLNGRKGWSGFTGWSYPAPGWCLHSTAASSRLASRCSPRCRRRLAIGTGYRSIGSLATCTETERTASPGMAIG